MSTRRAPRFERGKRARWDRYAQRWQRYLGKIAKLAPRREYWTGRPIVVPTESAFSRDMSCDVRQQRGLALFSAMERHR